jgi:hypothetical protein
MSTASPSPSSSSTFVRPATCICAATGDARYENLKKRTRLTVSKTWTTGLFRAFAARVELATCRFSVRTTGGRFGVLSAERRGGPPTGPICTTGLLIACGLWLVACRSADPKKQKSADRQWRASCAAPTPHPRSPAGSGSQPGNGNYGPCRRSRTWPSFFLCCWLSAHKQHVRDFFSSRHLGWLGCAGSKPPGWAGGGSRGHFFITHLAPRSMIAIGIISGSNCVHSMRWPKLRAELWLKR